MDFIQFLEKINRPLKRQGPGSDASTLKALGFCDFRNAPEVVYDVGCGTGSASLILAKKLQSSRITCVDIIPSFLEELKIRAKSLDLLESLIILETSMGDLNANEKSIDLIWSEGSIYNIGFKEGLIYYYNLLKSGGYLVASEITWLTNDRPEELESYWNNIYSQMGTASEKIATAQEAGFKIAGYFPLPAKDWTVGYYKPLKAELKKLEVNSKPSKALEEMISEQIKEIDFYDKYSSHLSYGFYILQKP